jgi:FHA domain-containing protein
MQNSAALNDNEALTQAFLRGADIPADAIGALTPELMELLGSLMARQLQGTIDLLALRSMVKQEARADVTMVVMRNNNPLKFFSDSQTVLTQMLRKKMPGFMEPLESVDDACRDLRAHQMGMLAGTRASIEHLVKRLAPDQLEASQPAGGLLEALIPGRRASALWARYVRLHASVAGASAASPKTLFGPDFLAAYEQEVELQVEREAGNAHG